MTLLDRGWDFVCATTMQEQQFIEVLPQILMQARTGPRLCPDEGITKTKAKAEGNCKGRPASVNA
jgi:hypothetical protein